MRTIQILCIGLLISAGVYSSKGNTYKSRATTNATRFIVGDTTVPGGTTPGMDRPGGTDQTTPGTGTTTPGTTPTMPGGTYDTTSPRRYDVTPGGTDDTTTPGGEGDTTPKHRSKTKKKSTTPRRGTTSPDRNTTTPEGGSDRNPDKQ